MITKIEAYNYRCLKRVSQRLDRFHVLVGANGSGKSTFFDVVGFVADIAKGHFSEAVSARTGVGGIPALQSARDLFWNQDLESGAGLAVELEIGLAQKDIAELHKWIVRYEIAFGFDREAGEVAIREERLWKCAQSPEVVGKMYEKSADGGDGVREEQSLFGAMFPPGLRPVLSRSGSQAVLPYSEDSQGARLMVESPPNTSILQSIPNGAVAYPAIDAFKKALTQQRQIIRLLPDSLRLPDTTYIPGIMLSHDGGNLPSVAKRTLAGDEGADWIEHLRIATPDLEGVEVVRFPDRDRQYLSFSFSNGTRLPAASMSDGILAMTALTSLAYNPTPHPFTICIEEPENHIHPLAVELVMQSLQSVYDSQVLVSTHSPLVVILMEPKQLLCFTRSEENGTEIVRGDLHPHLLDWKRSIDLGTLFAGGALQ